MIDEMEGIDRKATVASMKKYLKAYKYWKLKSMRRRPRLTSPVIDGQPKGQRKSPDQQIINHADANHEVFKRLDCIKQLGKAGEQEKEYSEILYRHFIQGWSIIKISAEMCISERTIRRYQEKALLECALLCEDDLLVFK